MIGKKTIYLEELGKIYGVNLVVEAEYCLSEGRAPTFYDEGYEGSFEFFKATVTQAYNDKFAIDRREASSWFDFLDELALNKIQKDSRYEQEICEELAEDKIDSRW